MISHASPPNTVPVIPLLLPVDLMILVLVMTDPTTVPALATGRLDLARSLVVRTTQYSIFLVLFLFTEPVIIFFC